MDNTMKAPTREIELPITKAKVVFKEWLTKRESERVKEPLRRHHIEVMGTKTDNQVKQSIAGDILSEIEHRTIEAVVVSVNGVSKDVLETCLELPEKDFDFLKDQVDAVLNPKGEKT